MLPVTSGEQIDMRENFSLLPAGFSSHWEYLQLPMPLKRAEIHFKCIERVDQRWRYVDSAVSVTLRLQPFYKSLASWMSKCTAAGLREE